MGLIVDGNYIEDGNDSENITVETNGGNYIESIKGNYVEGRVIISGGLQFGKSQEIKNKAAKYQQANPDASVYVVDPRTEQSERGSGRRKTDTEPDIEPGSRRRHPRTDRIIIMGGGNYNAKIEGDYIEGDVIG